MPTAWLSETTACMQACNSNRQHCAAKLDQSVRTASSIHEQDVLQSGLLNVALNAALGALGAWIGEAVASSVIAGIRQRLIIRAVLSGMKLNTTSQIATGCTAIGQTSQAVAAVYGNVTAFCLLNGVQALGTVAMTRSLQMPTPQNLFDFVAAYIATNDTAQLGGGVVSLILATALNTYQSEWDDHSRQALVQAKTNQQEYALEALLEDARGTTMADVYDGAGTIVTETYATIKNTIIPTIARRARNEVVPPALSLPLGINPLSSATTPQARYNDAVRNCAFYDAAMSMWARAYGYFPRIDAALATTYSMARDLGLHAYVATLREWLGLQRNPQ